MNAVLPTPVTVVSGASRTRGWRATLRSAAGETLWRCSCMTPHARSDLATACATDTLSQRDSGFYAGGYEMNDWMSVPTTDVERQALIKQIQNLPMSNDAALAELALHRSMIMQADSYEDIRRLQGAAESIKTMWRANREVRNEFDRTFLIGEWRIGQELLLQEQRGEEAAGHRFTGGSLEKPPKGETTLAEKVGNRTYGWRLKTIAPLAVEALNSAIMEYHQRDKEATLTGVVKVLRAEDSKMRRLDSLTAPAIQNGMDLRIGDCRVVLSDIEDDSIPLILTDPPYEDAAEPLWEWLAAFANRVLMPGGSLICYFGQANINKMLPILTGGGLTYWWLCTMMHEQAQRLPGKFVTVNYKPILWFVKEFRRGRTLVPDIVYSERRNKAAHAWGQGEGGVSQWIHQLTDPGETVLDPFCGTADWGLATCEAGRYWIGSDIVAGGTTTVASAEQSAEEDDTP